MMEPMMGNAELSLEDMSPGERAILDSLQLAKEMGHDMLHVNDLQSVTGVASANDVYDSLRRLVKHGYVNRPKSGTYALVAFAPEVEPLAPELIQIRRNPRELTKLEFRIMSYGGLDKVNQIKKTDCTSYNACLQQAIGDKWIGFSCTNCASYSAPDQFQRELDLLALRALDRASEEVERFGKVRRTRGAKPGAENKSFRDDGRESDDD